MANLTDADKVLRNDVGKTIASKLDDIADAIVAQGVTTIGNLSDLTTSDKSSLVGAVNEVNTKESYKVRVSQMTLPNTITLTANTATQVLNNTDIRTLGYSALDDIRNMTGTLVAAGFMWCSGGGALCPDTLVSDGKITMYLLSTYTKNITAIRLWTIWRQ